jgi:hypothetical protein
VYAAAEEVGLVPAAYQLMEFRLPRYSSDAMGQRRGGVRQAVGTFGDVSGVKGDLNSDAGSDGMAQK